MWQTPAVVWVLGGGQTGGKRVACGGQCRHSRLEESFSVQVFLLPYMT